jgi:aspartate 4-decarboxylase
MPGAAMDPTDLDRMSKLSPFELKNALVERAASHADRLMLNAGRANPNFLATVPRGAFFELGLFAVGEAEQSAASPGDGLGRLPRREGIENRFEKFAREQPKSPGIDFLVAALSYARRRLDCSDGDFLFELVQGVLGCNYPEPVRMLPLTAQLVRFFLEKEIASQRPFAGAIDLFAVEGATAGITYVFNSLFENRLLVPGDRIAIATPIFAPYVEIPRLHRHRLVEVAVKADPDSGWQYPACELDKLLDPRVKAFLLVNPGNPSSVKVDAAGLDRISAIIANERQDLIILTDDVYASFADDFVSLFALCPENTILMYSFSKYFGATGWRLGVIAMHENNILDTGIVALPPADRTMLDERYGLLTVDPARLKFIDRLAADSRNVALNHTAGLSTPQQIQIALFALHGLMDERDRYKRAVKRVIRGRHHALYRELGVAPPDDPNATGFYGLLDLEVLGARFFGRDFVDWFMRNKNPLEILFRVADEGGVVLLPGKGFGTPHPSARISLANLNEEDYVKIGRIIRNIMQEYVDEYRREPAGHLGVRDPSSSALPQRVGDQAACPIEPSGE